MLSNAAFFFFFFFKIHFKVHYAIPETSADKILIWIQDIGRKTNSSSLWHQGNVLS